MTQDQKVEILIREHLERENSILRAKIARMKACEKVKDWFERERIMQNHLKEITK